MSRRSQRSLGHPSGSQRSLGHPSGHKEAASKTSSEARTPGDMLSQIFFTGSGESWRQLVHFSRKLRWGLDRSYPDQINWHFDGWGRNVIWKHRPLHWKPVSKVTPAVRHLGAGGVQGCCPRWNLELPTGCWQDQEPAPRPLALWGSGPCLEIAPRVWNDPTYSHLFKWGNDSVWRSLMTFRVVPNFTSWIILPTYVSGLYLWKLTNQGFLVTRWFSRTVVRLLGLSEPGYNSLGCIKQLPPWQVDWLIVLSQETGKVSLGKFLVFLTLLKVLSQN